MRPFRFLVLVACFIAIPVFLTCFSLLRGQTDGANVWGHPQPSRFRALLSFSTPSALFPPSAIISLTFENSTFFLARPAAFGPSLPNRGLSGQLWIGKGFGDDAFLSHDALKISGFELGCSDVPGWGDDQKNTPDNPALHERTFKKAVDDSLPSTPSDSWIAADFNQADTITSDAGPATDEQDGTDDHLHRPLQDSNPATAGKLGESANLLSPDKSQKPNHADIESLQESADIAGKIVMLSRGGCGFLEKVKWTQRRGGIALIVGDNERNAQLTIMYAKGDTSNVTIPAIFTAYTSAHLLSSLVPPEHETGPSEENKIGLGAARDTIDSSKGKVYGVNKNNGPVFTTTSTSSKTQSRPTDAREKVVPLQDQHGWMQNVLQAVGLDDSASNGEDSRRPPASGNIEWVQVKNWDDDAAKTTGAGTRTVAAPNFTSTTKFAKQKTTSKAGDDDFVIGVQDWRDTEMIAPKSTATAVKLDSKAKNDKPRDQASNTATGSSSRETTLKGGSIIPGSGEYVKPDQDGTQTRDGGSTKDKAADHKDCVSKIDKIKSWFGKSTKSKSHASSNINSDKESWHKPSRDGKEGLWVTLTPTSVSSSPFFDTLLVLVVSPLVTLTFVYGLLLLRSRIRRRRWRAPKSVVDRLPIRTYHTMSAASSTTSSQLPSPAPSQVGSPQLRPEPVRSRQRSQTTIGVLSPPSSSSQSPTPEEAKRKAKAKPKIYRGRQVECVVCLEEYVDGESKVMSLPCGHEFHADCITPWLVNRRRTCPICKGDVVRSLARATNDDGLADEDNRESNEETSDDVQERAATTIPDNASAAAIPIPDRQDGANLMNEDIERGEEPPLEQDTQRPIASRWRGIINASLSSLSGDTVWRTNSVDRNR